MPDLESFRDDARAWLSSAEIPVLPRDYEARFEAMREWQRTLYDAGWVGVHWPKEFGGRGLSVTHHLVVVEELVRARAPHPANIIGLDVVGPTLVRYGTDEQKRRYVPPLLSGDELWCQGFSEPDAGSDLASLRMRAEIDGDEFVLNGQKVWTSWATHAKWCAVLARTGAPDARHRSISYLLVDMESPGLTSHPIIQITGDPEFSELFFDDVRVPMENLLGTLDGGWALAMDTLGHERGGYAHRRSAEHRVAFDDLVDELRTWYAESGEPVDTRIAEAIGRLDVALRGFSAQTADTIRRLGGAGPSALDSVDKLMLSRVEQQLCATAVDLLGPYRVAPAARPRGLSAERWLHDHLSARASSVYGGSAEIQRSIIAERVLGLPKGRS